MRLSRLTTRFVEAEDRFLISADSDAGVINLWLTQRLLRRLLPHLIAWVGKDSAEYLADVAMPAETRVQDRQLENTDSDADEKSRQHVKSQLIAQHRKPVARVEADQAVQSCLVTSLQLQPREDVLQLVFKLPQSDDAVLLLQEEHARLWLGALYKHWQQAQWPDIWPEWMKQAQQMRLASSGLLMH